MKIKIKKLRDNLISPMRSHYNDAGADCFSPQNFTLEPYSTTMIPLGFSIEVPDGYMAVIRPRSSMNVKGIITQIGTIDSGYRGEVKAVFVNPSNETFKFYEHDKICQIVIEPVVLAEYVTEFPSERGDGGFGSTGR